jgi:hypothetical protein
MIAGEDVELFSNLHVTGHMTNKCPVCGAEYSDWDNMTFARHVGFYHMGMEYSREIGKE